MDGFDQKVGVILIAATNRPDILDPALLRPGRFDRQIVVDRPDLEGRKAILRVHAKGKPLDPGADLDILARRTPGFTGADLANVINEAALLTARTGQKLLTLTTLEESIDRVMAGPPGRALGYTMVLPEEDKYSQTRAELLDTLAYAMGGRAAEELVFHDPTTGASNDI